MPDKKRKSIPFDLTIDDNSILTIFVAKFMFAVLIFIPCGVALASLLQRMNAYRHNYNLILFCGAFFALYGLIIGLSFRWYRADGQEEHHSAGLSIILICIGAFLVRVFVCLLLNGVPENDFFHNYNAAVDPISNAGFMSNVPYGGIYAVVLRLNMLLWGTTDAFVLMFFQSFVTSFIPLFLYLAVFKITRSYFTAFLSALLYAFFPSMILYCGCIAGENLSQFFMALLFLFMVYAHDAAKSKRIKAFIIYTLAACASGACVNLFKPIALFIMIVFVANEALYRILPAAKQAFRQRRFSIFAYHLAISFVTVFVLQLFNMGLLYASGKVIEHVCGEPVQGVYYGTDAFAEIAYFGLEKEGNGIWNQAVMDKMQAIIKNSATINEAHAEMLRQLKAQIAESPSDFVKLLHHKLEVSWADEWAYGYYASVPREGSTSLNDNYYGFFALTVVPNGYITVLYIGSIFCFILSIFSRKKLALQAKSILAMFFGIFMGVFLILEAHARYKSTFMPLLCILAAIGYAELAPLIGGLITRIKAMKIAKSGSHWS